MTRAVRLDQQLTVFWSLRSDRFSLHSRRKNINIPHLALELSSGDGLSVVGLDRKHLPQLRVPAGMSDANGRTSFCATVLSLGNQQNQKIT